MTNTKLKVCYQDLPVKPIQVNEQCVNVPVVNEVVDVRCVEVMKDVVNCNIKVQEIVNKKEIETEKLKVVRTVKDVFTDDGLDDVECLKKKAFVRSWNTLFHLQDLPHPNECLTDFDFVEHVRNNVKNNAQAAMNA